tara:strand:- start:69 stop:317 length:249 start_codon:yes stop_codon:yes gene_type:complete
MVLKLFLVIPCFWVHFFIRHFDTLVTLGQNYIKYETFLDGVFVFLIWIIGPSLEINNVQKSHIMNKKKHSYDIDELINDYVN